jgi:ABC-2 type transport system permease protein
MKSRRPDFRTSGPPDAFSFRRLLALTAKESVQVLRDPSAILIAFVLPVVLLVLFANAVSLDIRRIRLGVALESDGAAARSLAAAFAASRFFTVVPTRDHRAATDLLHQGDVRGTVVIPADFDACMLRGQTPPVQILTDGAQPNTAAFVANYAAGVVTAWQAGDRTSAEPISLAPRFWFNPEMESRRFLVPGAMAIVMTMIATMLTAMVVAREWERGTMEALFSTPASVAEIIVGKLLPYFVLGLIATVGSGVLAVTVFAVPLHGSWFALLLVSCAFLVPALGQGLLISALTRNQFLAAQVALFSGFLPAFLLSGFLFEIASMPTPVRALTHLIPARYFIDSLQTVFLVGDAWPVFLSDMLAMLALGAVLVVIAWRKTRRSLDR